MNKLEQAAQNLLDYFDRDDCGILFDSHMEALREALAEPVRTKDLTNEELDALWYGNTEGGWRGLFRAVIAADRSKNGIV